MAALRSSYVLYCTALRTQASPVPPSRSSYVVCCTAPHSTAHVGLARGLLKEREPGLSHVRVRPLLNAVDLPTAHITIW